MTVGELKQLLEEYPDDYRVAVVVAESEQDLEYQDFVPLPEHDPGVAGEEKLVLLYLASEEAH